MKIVGRCLRRQLFAGARHRPTTFQLGFTLVEILIALFIFAILALIVTIGLRSSLEAYQHVKAKGERFGELQVALTVMQRDITQAVPRVVTTADSQIAPALKGTGIEVDLTRGGYVNPQSIEKRSALQRIGYVYKNNELIRFTWPVLDAVKTTKPSSRVLLTGVDQFILHYTDQNNAARNFWPLVANQQKSLPRAVSVTMHVKNLGNISRLFLMPGGVARVKQ